MRKNILTVGVLAAVLSVPAMANTFNYGLGNASIKTGAASYSGLTYNLGANFDIAEDLVAVVDYATGTLKKTGHTNIDYGNSYVGIQYAVYAMGAAQLSLNLGSANVSAKQGAAKVTTAINNSGTRFGVGWSTAFDETSSLAINVDRDNSAKITATSMVMAFVVGENMGLTIEAANSTDFTAYSIGLSHGF